ncbi:MAG TPA: hydroxyisourate hydrolase [Tepidisphaeraceae bacterium]|jgi:5-hydroxyisourate hydrolase
MSGKLSTHVLDTASGKPASGVMIRLYREAQLLTETRTNSDGRTDAPLLTGEALTTGTYRLEFEVGDYFAATGNNDAKQFLDVVLVVFVVSDLSRSYHVPLLVSPWSYSTYRGS